MKPNGIAIRLRAAPEPWPGVSTETIICGDCGQRFAINADPGLQTPELTKRQACWVADQLVWDHIHERKHHGTMKLPNL